MLEDLGNGDSYEWTVRAPEANTAKYNFERCCDPFVMALGPNNGRMACLLCNGQTSAMCVACAA